MSVEILPLEGLPEVNPGDDLAALLDPPLRAFAPGDGDVLVVTQKVVSKAEGRLVPAPDRAEWIEHESVGIVARRGDLVIVRTRHGFVCANAGVDASNVPTGVLSLLPEDPDASAERLREELGRRLGVAGLGVVITDTFGRPWREGVVDVAIGCAGLPPLVDLRGTRDDRGRELDTTVVALADAVAAAGGLVMTKTARVPAALVRGVERTPGGASPGPARALIRAAEDDLFRVSAVEAVAGARPAAGFGPGPVPALAVEEAVRAATAAHAGVTFVTATSAAAARLLRAAATEAVPDARIAILACVPADVAEDRPMQLRVGAAVQALGVALHAQGLGWSWNPDAPFEPDRVVAALDLDRRWRPAAIVAIGLTDEARAGPERSRPRGR